MREQAFSTSSRFRTLQSLGNHWTPLWLTDIHPQFFLPLSAPACTHFPRILAEKPMKKIRPNWTPVKSTQWAEVPAFCYRKEYKASGNLLGKDQTQKVTLMHKHCLMLLLHKTDYNLSCFLGRHLWFSWKIQDKRKQSMRLHLSQVITLQPGMHLLLFPQASHNSCSAAAGRISASLPGSL